MAESVYLPADTRDDSKCLQQPLVPDCHLVDNVLVIGCSLIVHRPTAVYELKLAVFNESSDNILRFFILFIPPPIEKCYFHVDEFV